MTEYLLSIEGTDEGRRLALILALVSAFAHACFGALQKGRHDPWLSRGVIDTGLGVITVPLVLFVVPPPDQMLFLILCGALVIHTAYKFALGLAYERAAFTVVYPIVRGTGPLVTIIAAGFVFGEIFTPVQWLGVAVLCGGIFALAAVNYRGAQVDRDVLVVAIALAALTGLIVATYTTYDAWGIRIAENPFTFLVWFFMLDSLIMPIFALYRWRRMTEHPSHGPLIIRGAVGGVLAYISFGSVMLATRLDKVGEAAVLRETSTVFAGLIGWLVLKERVGPARAFCMVLIAVGAVVVEFGQAAQ